MMIWKLLHPNATLDMLGFLPSFLSTDDQRSSRDQFQSNYCSGWDPFPGHTLDTNKMVLLYPGDPPTRAIAETLLRDERIILFEHAWVAVIQQDGSYEVSRMD